MSRLILGCFEVLVVGLCLTACVNLATEKGSTAEFEKTRIPVIVVTDIYHPPQDPGDNFDLLMGYALPEVDLKAVVLDCTGVFRQPVASNPGPGLYPDPHGPREPGFIPVWQLNYIFNRNVPCATGPFTRMQSPQDPMLDVPAFQQQGIELILQVLRTNRQPVEILSFGSARTIAAAFNREPSLFRKNVARIHVSAGASAPGYLEWNVALDTNAIVCLLRSGLPVMIYPCAANNDRGVGYGVHSPAHSYDSHNTYYKLPDLAFIRRMRPRLRHYLEFAFARQTRMDFLRAMDEEAAAVPANLFSSEHYIWETGVWISATRRQLVRRADGHYSIVRADQVRPTDLKLPNEGHPCHVEVRSDGIYSFTETTAPSPYQVYFRGDPAENERALREALPLLYLSFSP